MPKIITKNNPQKLCLKSLPNLFSKNYAQIVTKCVKSQYLKYWGKIQHCPCLEIVIGVSLPANEPAASIRSMRGL